MAFKLDDRVKETTTTTGTGTVTLAGASTGYIAFSAFMANLDTTYYCIAGQGTSEWEVGIGTWNTGGTLGRTTVLKSSNAGAAVSFSAGTKDVFCTFPGNKVSNWGASATAGAVLYNSSATAPDISTTANLVFSGTALSIGNTTANAVSQAVSGAWSNSTGVGQIGPGYVIVGNTTYTTTLFSTTLNMGNTATNTVVSNSQILIGNTTVNTAANSTSFRTGNSTATATLASRNMTMGSWTGNTQPATPAADHGIMFFQTSANRQMLFGMGPSGIDYMVQPHVGRNRALVFWPKGNLAAITDAVGWTAVNTAVMIARTVTAAATANAMYLSMRKVSIASNTTANTVGELRADSAQIMYGNVAGIGGFHAIFRFAFNTLSTNGRAFVGFATGTGQLPNGNPSAQTNIIGCGREAAQLHLQIYSNDGTGTATMTNTGITCNTTADQSNAVYELVLFKPASTDVNTYWQLLKLNTNQVANGTISTDLVANNTLLCPRFWVCSGTDASVNALDIVSMYIESDN